MTEAQRLFLQVQSQFWLKTVASKDSSKGNKTFKATGFLHHAEKASSGKKPDLPGRSAGYFRKADATAKKIKRLHVEHDNMKVDLDGAGVKQEPAATDVVSQP
jgi:hypothetical protein